MGEAITITLVTRRQEKAVRISLTTGSKPSVVKSRDFRAPLRWVARRSVVMNAPAAGHSGYRAFVVGPAFVAPREIAGRPRWPVSRGRRQ